MADFLVFYNKRVQLCGYLANEKVELEDESHGLSS